MMFITCTLRQYKILEVSRPRYSISGPFCFGGGTRGPSGSRGSSGVAGGGINETKAGENVTLLCARRDRRFARSSLSTDSVGSRGVRGVRSENRQSLLELSKPEPSSPPSSPAEMRAYEEGSFVKRTRAFGYKYLMNHRDYVHTDIHITDRPPG